MTARPIAVPGAEAAAAVALHDNELIVRAGAGDRAAWAALVGRYLGPISGYAWHMLGDRGEAEDVAQETFVRLMGKAAAWDADGGATLKTWLYRVAINLCTDRRRKHLPVLMDELPEVADGGAAAIDERFDRARVVREALERLPERQRAVLALVYYQGFSNGEAAELLKVSVEAVESLLSRGRRALRAALLPLRDDLLGRD
jgi:RNA polymerase sigma-70 factor (ECF subfamily)